MSVTNAEKSLEYTKNLFIWSNYSSTVNELLALKILKIKPTLRDGARSSLLIKSVLIICKVLLLCISKYFWYYLHKLMPLLRNKNCWNQLRHQSVYFAIFAFYHCNNLSEKKWKEWSHTRSSYMVSFTPAIPICLS